MPVQNRILSFLFISILFLGCSKDVQINQSSATTRIVTNSVKNNNISCFAEDSFGYVWMGTRRGVVRYDRDKFLRYLHNSNSDNSLPSDIITTLFSDSKGTLWVGTVDGVARQTQLDEFCPVEFNHDDNRSQSIFGFQESPDGTLYMSTADFLQVYNSEEDRFEAVIGFDNGKALRSFYFDENGTLWYLSDGVVRYKQDPKDTGEGKILEIAGKNVSNMIMLENDVLCLMDNEGFLIFSIDLNLTIFDGAISSRSDLRVDNISSIIPAESTSFFIITNQNDAWLYDYSNKSLTKIDSPSGTNTVFIDSRENIWFGTTNNGYETVKLSDIVEGYKANLENYYKGVSIESLSKSQNGQMFINTSNGIYAFNQENGETSRLDFERFSTLRPVAVFMDSEQHLWVSTSSKCHLFRINGYSRDGQNTGSLTLSELSVFPTESGECFLEDSEGNVWFSTSSHSLYVCRKGSLTLERITLDVESGYMYMPNLVLGQDGNVYFPAFHYGIYQINAQTMHPNLILNVIGKLKSNFLPTCMIQTSDGEFWMGTQTEGVISYNPKTSALTHIDAVDCESINTIIEYPDGVIWIGTVDGIYSYDRKSANVVHYTHNDRDPIGEISAHSSLIIDNGNLVYGTKDGILLVNPSSDASLSNIDIYFDDLYINGNRVAPSKNGTIEKDMRYSPDVKLRKGPNTVSFAFCSPSYSSEMIEYWYKLEGFDSDWQKTVSDNTIQFSHLPEGRYDLSLQARDKFSGRTIGWNSLKVRVISPILTAKIMTNIIYPLLGLLFVVGLLYVYIKYKRNKLEKERILKEKQSEEDLNKMNVSFFTNMSHEFRTPLTLIQGPVEELSEIVEDTPYNRGLVSTVKRSVDRMLKLIDQIMDFSKLETDALNLSLYECNISALFQGIVAPFKYSCTRKGLKYEVNDYCDGVNSFVDPDKFEKILNNLLSNAVKYTPAGNGGMVKVSIQQIDSESTSDLFRQEINSNAQSYLLIEVSDNGIGIPEDKLDEIFERYRMLESEGAEKQYSSGIGLYYVRRIVTLHHGVVEASRPDDGHGSCFRVLLPMDKEEYEGEIFVKGTPANIMDEDTESVSENEINQEDRPSILLVEDDVDVASYISSLLGKFYDVKVRYSATEACEEIKLNSPDMLITDIMLPGDMDGLMLCKFIKENLETCHVPVMVLSAKSTLEDQIRGIETGADSYVTKPVAPAYLLTLTKTLLSNREKLRTRLQETTDVAEIEETNLLPQDKLFLESLYEIMEKQLSSNELNVDMMAESLKMSRAKLYYKFKGLINETPNSFFKKYKLNRAAELLKSGKYNISEVSDMTGFSSLSYFSVSFKKQFGVKPSEYC